MSGKYNELSQKTNNKTEAEITDLLLDIINTQKAQTPHLSWSEEVVFKIRERVLKHMDGNISIDELSKEYNISQKSMQNSFKSLFGFTPKEFLRLMKLNLVHHELIRKSREEVTVTEVSQKWGFPHQGRFSRFYTELFLENPLATLKREPIIDGMREDCVERKEEMF